MRTMATLISLFVGGVCLASGCSSSSYNSSYNDASTAYRDASTAVGDSAAGENNAQAAVLTIASGMRFPTANLVVPGGTTVTVENHDSLPHTVTSETAPNDFRPSGVFDTGIVAAGGSATIVIPGNALAGTVYYYYCSIHTSAMVPPNGMITVQ